MTEITRQDLMESENRIKEYIGDKLAPITSDINGHQITLYGKEGRNELVGDVRDMKTGVGTFKWLAGTSCFLVMGCMLARWWHSLSWEFLGSMIHTLFDIHRGLELTINYFQPMNDRPV